MANRLEIASTVHGDPDAPTVILIHGVVHQQHAWDPVVPLLAEKYRVVTFDLPGHGASGAIPEGSNPIPFVLDSLVDVIGELGGSGQRPHLVGNSLGGYVALEMGSRGLASGVTGISPASASARSVAEETCTSQGRRGVSMERTVGVIMDDRG